MPLSERARVEVYLPNLPRVIYQALLATLTREFTYTFGGCTIVAGLDGNYLSQAGRQIEDPIALIYTDTPYSFERNLPTISTYSEKLKTAVLAALEEEAILVAAMKVYHAE